ncbi:MAG: hypothetical protein ACYC1Z_07110 [Georgenia sp.]
MATAGRGRLRGGEIAVVALTALLVIVLAVMLVQRFGGGVGSAGGTPSATGTAAGPAQEPTDGGSTGSTVPTRGEDLGGITFDFVSPSGNIGCAVSVDRALCGIATYDYADAIPAAEVKACDGSVGQFLQVTAKGAGLVCDTSDQELTIATDGVDVLEYGSEVTIDGFTCRSETDGVSCRHDESGYSFSVRRAGYTLS